MKRKVLVSLFTLLFLASCQTPIVDRSTKDSTSPTPSVSSTREPTTSSSTPTPVIFSSSPDASSSSSSSSSEEQKEDEKTTIFTSTYPGLLDSSSGNITVSEEYQLNSVFSLMPGTTIDFGSKKSITIDNNTFSSDGGYKLWRKTHRLARGMKAAFLCKSACPLLGICID